MRSEKREKSANRACGVKSVLDRAVETFDLPAEVLRGMPKLTATGSVRLHIECHQGLLEYDPSLIIINGGEMLVTVRGQGMDISAMNSEEILIKGLIRGIDFE
jgi:sporulation protein YqfC